MLDSSACFPDSGALYANFSGKPTEYMPVHAADLVFTETSGRDTPVFAEMKKAGVTRSFIFPLNYYFCPALQRDSGRLHAMRYIRTFAEAHPELAAEERARLMEGSIFEGTIAPYLTAAKNGASRPEQRAAVAELELMFNTRSAGLEFLLGSMNRIIENHLQSAADGIPFDISVPTRFLMHSALPSFFAAYSDDTYVSVLSPHTERDTQDLADYARSYAAIRETVSIEEMSESLRKFLIFEGRLPAASGTSEE
jgi:hypothetical protein